MTRKKRPTRKYSPRNEFRRNDSPHAEGHPHYVFGETRSGKYKSLGLTTHPVEGIRHVKLSQNPNPQRQGEDSYLQLEVHTAKKDYYTDSLPNWKFASDDMSIVRHRIKEYKKSTNRKPKKRKKRSELRKYNFVKLPADAHDACFTSCFYCTPSLDESQANFAGERKNSSPKGAGKETGKR